MFIIKKFVALLLTLSMVILLVSCSSGGDQAQSSTSETSSDTTESTSTESQESSKPQETIDESEVIVFAAASMTETLNKIAENYKQVDPSVKLTFNFDSSGTLKTQIQEQADCDIFISAAQKQMNEMDINADSSINVDGLDLVASDSRFDIVANSVVLIVPKDNPADIQSFEDIGSDKLEMIAIGNADVPVGQYSEEILTHMNIWENLNNSSKITFGSNVKEVLSQVAEGVVDCGIVYSTDAATTENVEIVGSAPEGSHKAITYPAALLKASKNQEKAQAFLDYLKTNDCTKIFEEAGFIKP